MKEELKKHAFAYSVLGLGLAVIMLLFIGVAPDRIAQRWVAIGLGFFYFLWGVVTHTKSDHITGKIILEYFLMALLASALVGLVTI